MPNPINRFARGDINFGAWVSLSTGTSLSAATGFPVLPTGIFVTTTGVVNLLDQIGNSMAFTVAVANTKFDFAPAVILSGTTAVVYGLW